MILQYIGSMDNTARVKVFSENDLCLGMDESANAVRIEPIFYKKEFPIASGHPVPKT